MRLRQLDQSWALTGLAASLSVSLAAIVAGCGADTTDKAVVTVSEPSAAAKANATTAPAASANVAPAANSAEAPAAAATSTEGWGTLKGRVVFGGDAPAPKVLIAKGDKDVKDAAVCAKNEIDSERLVVNKANKGVRYAIVYLPKPTAVNKEAEGASKKVEVIFDQKNCTFVPHVLATMKGTSVSVTSSDPVGHNANGVGFNYNAKFNMTTASGSAPSPVLLKAAEPKPAEVNCDIHNWMKSYWFVSANPYFAVTDADGNFEIKNVPAGDQKVIVWCEAIGPGTLTAASGDTVAIKAGGETSKEFTLDAAKVK